MLRLQEIIYEGQMVIADRLKMLREEKNFSQGEIEKRTGLLRCYISRVENGHTVPSIDTLEKLARALEVPMYQLFYDGSKPAKPPSLPKHSSDDEAAWGNSGKDEQTLRQFRRLLSRTREQDRKILLFTAQKMAESRRA
jgi:transcriptional regulator with XRE-family HTH domain